MKIPPPGAMSRVVSYWTASLVTAAAFWWGVAQVSSLAVWTIAIIPGALVGSMTAFAARRSSHSLALLLVLGATASALGGEYCRTRRDWQLRFEQDAELLAKLSPQARQALPGFLAGGFCTDLADRPIELAAGILLGSIGAIQAGNLVLDRRSPTP